MSHSPVGKDFECKQPHQSVKEDDRRKGRVTGQGADVH